MIRVPFIELNELSVIEEDYPPQ